MLLWSRGQSTCQHKTRFPALFSINKTPAVVFQTAVKHQHIFYFGWLKKKQRSEEADRRQVRGSEKADTVEKVTDSEGRDEVRRKGAAQKDKEQEGKKDAAIVLFCKFTFIIPSLRLSNGGE